MINRLKNGLNSGFARGVPKRYIGNNKLGVSDGLTVTAYYGCIIPQNRAKVKHYFPKSCTNLQHPCTVVEAFCRTLLRHVAHTLALCCATTMGARIPCVTHSVFGLGMGKCGEKKFKGWGWEMRQLLHFYRV